MFSYDYSYKFSMSYPYSKFICIDQKRHSSFAVVSDLQVQGIHFSMCKYLQMHVCVYRRTLIFVCPSAFGKTLF